MTEKLHAFLTGATGAIGSFLLEELIRRGHEVTLLVRAGDDSHLALRVQELIRFCGLSAEQAGRIHALRGDINLPRLGLSPNELREVFSKVDRVIHGAASVKLTLPAEEARRISVDSTRTVLQAAREFGLPARLKKIDFVSTVGVGGRTFRELPEGEISEFRVFHNTYEEAKAEAEVVLFDELRKGLPITLLRPSMVVGDASTGRIIHFQVFYFLCEFLSGRKTFGLMPDLGARTLDVINVDYVARAMAEISEDLSTTGEVYHLSSGEEFALPLKELQRFVREFFESKGIICPRTRVLPNFLLHGVSRIVTDLPGQWAQRYRVLPQFLAYLKTEQSFGNVRTRRYLEARGIRLEAPYKYLGRVLDYYFDRKLR